MSINKKNIENSTLSRRNILKYTATGLLSWIAARLVHPHTANAAEVASEGKKILVVYYSRTGNTRIMANYIHKMVGGDIIEIQTVHPYPTEYRQTTVQAKKELESGYKPPLKTKINNMASYDLVFVGSPCWWGTIGTPVISFLSKYDFSGKTLVPFMTHLGSGLGRTMAHVGSLCPRATLLEGHAVRGDEINSSREDVSQWLQELGMV